MKKMLLAVSTGIGILSAVLIYQQQQVPTEQVQHAQTAPRPQSWQRQSDEFERIANQPTDSLPINQLVRLAV